MQQRLSPRARTASHRRNSPTFYAEPLFIMVQPAFGDAMQNIVVLNAWLDTQYY
jgi:hypothetical protein